MQKIIPHKSIFLLFALVYFLSGFIARGGDYWNSLALEATFALVILAIYKRTISWKISFSKISLLITLAYLVTGFSLHRIADYQDWSIPFQLDSWMSVFVLVGVAPFLEELLFRGILQWSLSSWMRSTLASILLSAAWFSLSHLKAISMVPELYKPFIIYQTIYTLLLGLLWGWHFHKTKSFLQTWLYHLALNAGFGISLYATQIQQPTQAQEHSPSILVVDMAVDPTILTSLAPTKKITVLPSPHKALELSSPQCSETLSQIETFFKIQLTNTSIDDAEFLQNIDAIKLEEGLKAAHGYHIVGLVSEGLQKFEVMTLGLGAPPSMQTGIQQHQDYIQNSIYSDMALIDQTLQELAAQNKSPKIVVIASSDSIEENYADLLTGGYTEKDASAAAAEIMQAWYNSWDTLVSSHPGIYFLVPSGNGGLDWKGDDLEKRSEYEGPIPAILHQPNLVKVAASDDAACLAPFSNYGRSQVELSAPGIGINSWAPCRDRPYVYLTGSSQSVAIAANRIARALENGAESIATVIKSAQQHPCLESKVLHGDFK